MAIAFRPGHMTVGAITPLQGFAGPIPRLSGHVEVIQQAEDAGFASIWVRDVPLFDPSFGDTGQVFDTWTYLGYLAAKTERISIGTASVVLPLRHPIDVAKAATSVDRLSGGRLLLGLATGDRPVEFPAYGVDYESRGDRFREALAYLRQLTEEQTPTVSSPLGIMDGTDLLPKPVHGRLPFFMTGRGRQQLDWIAEHADGWLFYTLPLEHQALNIKQWRRHTRRDQGTYKPFAQATYIDLAEDPRQTSQEIRQGFSLGREPLLEYMNAWQEIGVDQLMVNFKHSRRPATDVIAEFREYVLPHFPAGEVSGPTAPDVDDG